MRWDHFESLVRNGTELREPGFALALHHQVSGEEQTGRQALRWAFETGSDIRQLSIVFDWCQDLLREDETAELAARIRAASGKSTLRSVGGARDVTFAAAAIADTSPEFSETLLRSVVEDWWKAVFLPVLAKGFAISGEELYALLEILHVLRDNLRLDLQETARDYFKSLPLAQIAAYYPSPYTAPENFYRIPASTDAAPNLTRAALSRAAELALVAYSSNSAEVQFLQGWAMHDQYLMRSAFGAVYELLWANPYQPGLSYHTLPLAFHDHARGRLFLRSSWEDEAEWLGYFDGQLQAFNPDGLRLLSLDDLQNPIHVGLAAVVAAPKSLRLNLKDAKGPVFVLGLKPNSEYQVTAQDLKTREQTDGSGILCLPAGASGSIRLRATGANTR